MRRRWDILLTQMERAQIDCLLMYSTDRLFSAYLRYVTDCPTVMYPMAGLFSKQGISLVGHGARGIPLFPPPVKKLKEGQFHAGGVQTHAFIRDLIGLPACPTTTYVSDMWPEAIAELIRKYGYRRIGLVGLSMIPASLVQYLRTHMSNLDLTDATALVDSVKCQKSPYELRQAEQCVQIIDELMAAAPSVLRIGQNIREIGRKLRALADGYDCLDVNIMLGKHPTMPMFSDWIFTDEEILTPEDCVELMIEVSSNTGFWGECARVFSLGRPPQALQELSALAFQMQDYLAGLVRPGADPSKIFEQYCNKLSEHGFPPEQRFCCHGQGFDVVEAPFIRPENHVPIAENTFVAVHPSMYRVSQGVGCFVCDNYLVTSEETRRMNRTPREIIQVCQTGVPH